jgi:23S rRNA pseudouridine1911/1915/1917 synthase
MPEKLNVLYEDNHLIIINKKTSEIVHGDKTGDVSLSDDVKSYLKEKYNKPGNVYLGLPHRLDRPVSGIVLFTKTEKSLSRLNKMFMAGTVYKTYWAIVENPPQKTEDTLIHYVIRNEKQNKTFVFEYENGNAKQAILIYKVLYSFKKYYLLEVKLKTGRHHQIRCQLAHIGCPIKGDLKYGSKRSNPGGGISLHARKISFLHPVTGSQVVIYAPPPDNVLWNEFIAQNEIKPNS